MLFSKPVPITVILNSFSAFQQTVVSLKQWTQPSTQTSLLRKMLITHTAMPKTCFFWGNSENKNVFSVYQLCCSFRCLAAVLSQKIFTVGNEYFSLRHQFTNVVMQDSMSFLFYWRSRSLFYRWACSSFIVKIGGDCFISAADISSLDLHWKKMTSSQGCKYFFPMIVLKNTLRWSYLFHEQWS